MEDQIPPGEKFKALAYQARFMRKNKLVIYRESFVNLDNVINLFFMNYAKLDRSSFNCASLWLGVMKLRTLMTNAVQALGDQERFLGLEFEDVRLKEMNSHVRPARMYVAKAVQYLLIYRKHADEEWRFLRKGFLAKHAQDLMNSMFEASDSWRDYLIEAYDLRPTSTLGFKEHLELQERKFRLALVQVEPKSEIAKNNNRYKEVLDNMLKNKSDKLIFEKDFYMLRIQTNTVEDINKIATDIVQHEKDKPLVPEWSENLNDSVEEAQNFLKSTLPPIILEDDDRIWPHQMGLPDLGPFSFVGLPNPSEYFNIETDANGHPTQASLKDPYLKVKSLSLVAGKKGMITRLHKMSFSPNVRAVLGIPASATHFAWLFPFIGVHPNDSDPEADKIYTKARWLADDESPLHVICLYGGFIYFDAKKVVVAVKGVTFGDDLYYDGPYFVPTKSAYRRLEEHGVPLSETTLEPIRAFGAARFGWMMGEEELALLRSDTAVLGVGSPGWKFGGAFIYEYDNSNHPEFDKDDYFKGGRRNYFQELNFEELELKKAKNNNNPVMNKLKDLVEKHKEEWVPRKWNYTKEYKDAMAQEMMEVRVPSVRKGFTNVSLRSSADA